MNYGLQLNKYGNWEKFLPTYEPQILKDGTDENGCWIWGTLNLLEIVLKIKDGKDYNLSERFLYNGLLSDGTGGNPINACEFIHKNGIIDNELLPTPDTLAELKIPRPLTNKLLCEAKQFPYKIYYSKWYTLGIANKISEFLEKYPIGVTLYAWTQDEKGLYYRPDQSIKDNHFCVLFKETDDFYCVFDTYDHSIKNVRKDMGFGMFIIIYVLPKTMLERLSDKIKCLIN